MEAKKTRRKKDADQKQNKEVLTNLNALAGIEIAEGPVKTVITSYITGCSYLLGEYSNKEKAVKVLDMIQEAYVNGHIDYQMPEDSEVEIND